jgi:hypothetical protein
VSPQERELSDGPFKTWSLRADNWRGTLFICALLAFANIVLIISAPGPLGVRIALGLPLLILFRFIAIAPGKIAEAQHMADLVITDPELFARVDAQRKRQELKRQMKHEGVFLKLRALRQRNPTSETADDA